MSVDSLVTNLTGRSPVQEVAETLEKRGLKEEAIEFYTQVSNVSFLAASGDVSDFRLTRELAAVTRRPTYLLARSRLRKQTNAA